MLDWSRCPEVESDPEKLGGKWLFKHSRLPVSVLFGNLAMGATLKEVSEWYDIEERQLVAVLEFVETQLQHPAQAEAAA
jgi:uncharacterized protein (DUF433 family)